MSVMLLNFRTIKSDDKEFLREMLYQAVFVPPGQNPYDRSILDLPDISRYISNWGTKDDFGLMACINDEPIGAVWARLFDLSEKGFGYVDDQTPELTIAIIGEYRNKGIGRILMEKFFLLAIEQGYSKVSLSVDQRNPAFGFYQRLGFVIEGGTDQSPTMVKKLVD
jgi:GNAT superfamily N-acetyltransferase